MLTAIGEWVVALRREGRKYAASGEWASVLRRWERGLLYKLGQTTQLWFLPISITDLSSSVSSTLTSSNFPWFSARFFPTLKFGLRDITFGELED